MSEETSPQKYNRFGNLRSALRQLSFLLVIVILFLGALNYFNLLPLRKINNIFLGLPHKPYTTSIINTTKQTSLQSTATPTPTIFPYDSKTAESLLTQYLKDTLKPEFLPTKIDIKQGLSIDNRNDNLRLEFGSYFATQGTTISANFHYKENSNDSNDFSIFVQPENATQATATASLANSLLSTYFKNPYSISTCQTKGVTSYCENFKTTAEEKTGYGIVLNNANSKLTSIVFTCFIPKSSKDYNSLKSCISP